MPWLRPGFPHAGPCTRPNLLQTLGDQTGGGGLMRRARKSGPARDVERMQQLAIDIDLVLGRGRIADADRPRMVPTGKLDLVFLETGGRRPRGT